MASTLEQPHTAKARQGTSNPSPSPLMPGAQLAVIFWMGRPNMGLRSCTASGLTLLSCGRQVNRKLVNVLNGQA